MKRIAYPNSAQATRALAAVWKEGRPRPYNRFLADEGTTWWAVPSADWPAFRHGKLMASQGEHWIEPGQMFVGFYVEKGLGAVAEAAGLRRADWIMDETWCWHRVIRDLEGGSFGRAIAVASDRLREPLQLLVSSAYVQDAGARHPAPDVLSFHVGADQRLHLDSKQTPNSLLDAGVTCTLLPDLARALRAVPAEEWAWIDLCLGQCFQPSRGEVDHETLDARGLWHRVGEPFTPWLT